MDEINASAAIEFLSFGVPYAFPAQLGSPARGIPTAFSAQPLAAEIVSDDRVVWPNPNGPMRGTSLVPLYPAAPEVSQTNPRLYRLLALVDGIRVGRARERRSARAYLEEALSSSVGVWIDD
jgi:hypothetical protein